MLTVACHLFGTKPFSKLVLCYCEFDNWKQTLMKFEWKYEDYHLRTLIWKCYLQNARYFVSRWMCCVDTNHDWVLQWGVVSHMPPGKAWIIYQSKIAQFLYVLFGDMNYIFIDFDSPSYIRDPNLVIKVLAYIQTPDGARQSAGVVTNT